jgi:hypothetical protein
MWRPLFFITFNKVKNNYFSGNILTILNQVKNEPYSKI